MLRMCLIIAVLVATTAVARADAAEEIAAELWRAVESEDPYRALSDVLLGQVLHIRPKIEKVETFVVDPYGLAERRAAIVRGDCDAVYEIELAAFLERFPEFRPTVKELELGSSLRSGMSVLTDSRVCFANRVIMKEMAGRTSLAHLGFPVIAGEYANADRDRPRLWTNTPTVRAIVGGLDRLRRGAICENDTAAIASLLRYAVHPRLVEFRPDEAYYLFTRARTHGLDPAEAERVSPLHDASQLTAAERERIARVALDERPAFERDVRMEWERCFDPRPSLNWQYDPLSRR